MSEFHRLKERSEALAQLREIGRHAATAFAIHYSSESFYDTVDGKTSRVTSIAIRNLATAQTNSFSIHKTSEQLGLSLADIASQYDALEKQMLDEYFGFLKGHPGYKYVHWNMRDINYGFQALEHRYKVLKGDPFILPDADKFDLARALVAIYSRSYIGHGEDGRFLNICRFNKITDKDALTGKREAEAFTNHEYVKLHRSTLRKVDMMANVFERVRDGSLKTEARWGEIYGLTPTSIVNAIKEHWIYSLVVIGLTVGGALAKVFNLI